MGMFSENINFTQEDDYTSIPTIMTHSNNFKSKLPFSLIKVINI